MRVAIDYRILSVGPYLMRRGMGRYTQQQLRAVLAVDSDTEYLLVCPPDTDLSLIDQEILTAPNVSECRLPVDVAARPGSGQGDELRRAEILQAWSYRQGFDVFHATTPFQVAAPALSSFDACPLVATVYDLIPLLYPDAYLADPAIRHTYVQALSMVVGARRWIAISEATRLDAHHLLGLPLASIDVAYPVPDPSFRPLGDGEVAAVLGGLRQRIPVPARFALSVSFPHHSKNIEGLLRSYALLPARARLRVPLVLCCLLHRAGVEHVQRLLAELDLAGDVVVTGLVSDSELGALYNGASFVVHPSRYEGFGLPVVEAMRCGTPVVTTTASSLPEVGGDAALLVDPDDHSGMASAMERLMEDGRLREDMARRGLAHSSRFEPGQLAARTLDAYREAARCREDVPGRPRVAVWTPLPPQESGVADYSAELLGELAADVDVEVFVDDDVVPAEEVVGRHTVHHHSAFSRRQEQSPFDAVVYQLGASLLHQYMYEPLQRWPGIAVVHDLPWSYARYAYLRQRGEAAAFRLELAALEGPEALAELDAAERRWAAHGRVDVGDASEEDFWDRRPMLGRVVTASTAQLVHSEALGRALTISYPAARPWCIPPGVVDPHDVCSPEEVETARDELTGGGAGPFVVGIFGIVHPAKRLESCLLALADVAGDVADARLVVVGRALDPAYLDHLHGLAERLGLGERVRFTGHVSWPRFYAHLGACDVVVNLRAPLLRQASGTLMRALAAGRPVLVSEGPEAHALPDDCCRRVATGEDERRSIASELRTLAGDPGLRTAMGTAARTYFEAEGTIGAMADRYRELIAELTGRSFEVGEEPIISSRARWEHVVEMLRR